MGTSTPTQPSSPVSASNDAWREALWLPCELRVDIKVPKFTVGDLLRLERGSVINTLHAVGTHVPVKVNGLLIAWGEFGVREDGLTVRLTGLT